MNREEADALFKRIEKAANSATELDEKNIALLGKLLYSETLISALGIVLSQINVYTYNFLSLNLSDPVELGKAIQLQGYIRGINNTIESIIGLAVIEQQNEKESQ